MFGDEWSYQPGYVDAPADPAPTTGIPYYLAKPDEVGSPAMVDVNKPEGSSTSVADWFGMGKQVVGTFVDIFGRPVQPGTNYPMTPPDSGIPIWGWALIGIGAVGIVGFAIRSLKKPSYAGRRRRSRR